MFTGFSSAIELKIQLAVFNIFVKQFGTIMALFQTFLWFAKVFFLTGTIQF